MRNFFSFRDRQPTSPRPVRKRPAPQARLALESLERREVPSSVPAVPVFNSNPGAPASLYLDFDGHYEPNWAGFGERTSILSTTLGFVLGGPLGALVTNLASNEILGAPSTPVFSLDSDYTTFSATELSVINEICDRVAEDYAPFNINVTTVNPGNFDDGRGLRVSIGGTGDWYKFGGASFGIALHNAFSNVLDNCVFVFAETLAASSTSGGAAGSIAKSTSHEAGHALGLAHKLSSPSGRFAIMRQGAANTMRTTWTDGNNEDGNWQDDMALIARGDNRFGYRADDHANFYGQATPLTFASQRYSGSGLIGQTSDVDWFSFSAQGAISITVKAAVARNNAAVSVANLDVGNLELRDANGSLVSATVTPNGLDATLTANVVSGTYYLGVRSQGSYGDVGRYTIEARETSGPRITTAWPYRDRVRVTFHKPVDPATLTAADVRLTNRAGATISGVAVAAVVGTDNRTWDVTFPAPAGGGYRLVLGPNVADRFGNLMNQDADTANGEAAADQYALEDFAGPRVTGVTHEAGSIRVQFNESLDVTTMTALDVSVTNAAGTTPVTVREVRSVSSSTFDILVNSFAAGGFRVQVGPDVTDRFGNPMNQDADTVNGEATQDRYTFTYTDATAPRVLDAWLADPTPPPGFPTTSGLAQTLVVTFSEEMDLSTFTAANVQIVGPNGAATIGGMGLASMTNGYTYTISFQAAGYGSHTLTIGAAVTDLFGNRLNQDADATFGEAIPDRFQLTFRVDMLASTGRPTLDPNDPLRLIERGLEPIRVIDPIDPVFDPTFDPTRPDGWRP